VSDLPGTLWVNRGRWNWKVRLPGTDKRGNYPLRQHGAKVALAESKGRDVAESIAWRMWETASKAPHEAAHDACMTLETVIDLFLRHAETYYRRADGSQTREAVNCELALRSLRGTYGRRPVDDLSYADVLAARDELVAAGLNRTTINQRVGIWRRCIAWALENRHCSVATKSDVWALANMKKGRCASPEGEPVGPVSHRHVKTALKFMPPNLAAMVRVQEFCGARPSEMCDMRPCDFSEHRGVHVYRPARHKTEHKGGFRVIVLGPRAMRILSPWCRATGPEEHIFHPERAGGGPQWDANTYGKSIRYAIRAARKAGLSVVDWSPNQLRHACGTRVRRKFGPLLAAAVLGHASVGIRITDRYTKDAIEREAVLTASPVMKRIG
jgi:integrase